MPTFRENPYGAFNFLVSLGGATGDGGEGTIIGGFSDASAADWCAGWVNTPPATSAPNLYPGAGIGRGEHYGRTRRQPHTGQLSHREPSTLVGRCKRGRDRDGPWWAL